MILTMQSAVTLHMKVSVLFHVATISFSSVHYILRYSEFPVMRCYLYEVLVMNLLQSISAVSVFR